MHTLPGVPYNKFQSTAHEPSPDCRTGPRKLPAVCRNLPVHPFAALTVTYLTSALASGILYFALAPQPNLLKECSRLNWASFLLGISIIGLEGGWLYAYRAGWQVNTGFLVQSAFVSVLLLFVGYFLYHEALTWNKLVGVVICLLGLFFIPPPPALAAPALLFVGDAEGASTSVFQLPQAGH